MGTAYYVSPEMLNESRAVPGSDYWALGCILYKLLFGAVPFEGANENLTFEKILNRELVFPGDADENAKDLIDRLLRIDVADRITDFETLRAHPFFDAIDFDTLQEKPVPFDYEFPAARLGSSLGLSAGATETTERPTFTAKQKRGEIVFQGELKKKNRYHMRQVRLFTLANDGQVKYYKAGKIFRGGFWLTKDSRCLRVRKSGLEIRIPGRTYHLEEVDK